MPHENMLQQIMPAPHKVEFREVSIPEIKKGEVLIKIMKIGICGSDIHVNHGLIPFVSYPLTQGHEISGEIVALGEGVKNLQPGQKVTVQPQIVCGKCFSCRTGKYYLCENLEIIGIHATGMASHYFSVAAEKVTPLPEKMGFDEGAMIEPLAVAVHAVRQAGDVSGLKVAVLGAGPIGNLVGQAAKGLGAASVLMTDVSDFRLNKAKECGIDFIANTKTHNFGDVVLDCFGPDKADVIFDCAGNNITIGQAITYARKGTKIILVAIFSEIAKVDLTTLMDHELQLGTSMMYRNEDYLDAIRLADEQKILLRPLISKHFNFTDYQKAYEYIDENRETTMKVIIDVN